MSTKNLLNHHGQTTAARRRTQAVKEMRRMAHAFAPGSQGRFRVESLAAALDEVRKDPRFTGAEKDEKFRSLLNRAR